MACQKERDFRPLLAATRKGAPYHTAHFVLETALWIRSCPDRQLLSQLQKPESLARNKTLQARKLGFIFRAASTLDECYDTAIPLNVRRTRLGKMLEQTSRFEVVEHDLLHSPDPPASAAA